MNHIPLSGRNRTVLGLLFLSISLMLNAQSATEWYNAAQERIDTLRKGAFGLQINDRDGQPFEGDISVRMTKHEYPFGIAFDLYEGEVNNGNVYRTTSAITAPEDAEIYQSERYYSYIAYAIPVEKDRDYKLTLKFAEIFFNNTGSRLFDVYVEGTKYLSEVDMFALAGGNNTAFDTTLALSASDEIVNIEFVAILDNAAPKGIEIQTAEGDWITRINCGGGALTTADGNDYESDEDFYDLNAARYPSHEQWMKAAMYKYFNYGACGNSFKWSGIQPQHTAPDYTNFDHAVEWTQSVGWELRAHTLLWGGDDDHSMPGWVRALPTPEAITDTCKMRVIREVTHYKGIIKEYDVINEPLTDHADWLRETVGDSILWNCFKWARSADPDAELYINDYNVELNWGQSEEYRDLILQIKEMGGPVTGVGVQAHFWDCCRPNVDEIVRNMNIIAEAGLPIRFTEYDWGTDLTQEQQASDFIKVLTIAFSHPSINGMICWGLSDAGAWRENTGFFDVNRKPKLAADTLLYYTKTKWATNFDTLISADETVLFNAYYGDYTVEVDFNDTVKVFTIPCLQAHEDSVFILNEADAMIKGPVLTSIGLLNDSALILEFDKSIQAESVVDGNFKFFSDSPVRILDISPDPVNDKVIIISLQQLITPDDFLEVSYFPGNLSSTDGGKALAFGPEKVINLTTGLLGGSVINDGYDIEAVFNTTVRNLSENAASFTVKDNGVDVGIESVEYNMSDSSRIILRLSVPLTSTSQPTIRYTKGSLESANGFVCQSSNDITVSNIWPRLVSAAVSENGMRINASFNTLLMNVSENMAAFTVAVDDETAEITGMTESGTEASTLGFDLAEPISSGQGVKLSYEPGTIAGYNGNSLAEINEAAVANNSAITGIDQPMDDEISIIPNPAHSEVFVSWESQFSELIILNMEGKKLIEKTYGIPVGSASLRLDLEKGLYLMILKNENKVETQKLIIE